MGQYSGENKQMNDFMVVNVVRKCPVCGSENVSDTRCMDCGFDEDEA